MQIEKFIHNAYNLREFVEHFQHYLEFMRIRELVTDYRSAYGEPVVKTKLEAIEQFAGQSDGLYKRGFRTVLGGADASQQCESYVHQEDECLCFVWECNGEEDDEFSCLCQHMESFRLPCVHMVGILVYLNMTTIPRSLILDWWTKRAKQPSATSDGVRVGKIPDTTYISMHAAMLDNYRELVNLSCRFFDDYLNMKTRLAREHQFLWDKHRQRLGVAEEVRCGRRVVTSRDKFCSVQRYRVCGKAEHNSRKCHKSCTGENIGSCEAAVAYESMVAGEGGEDYFDFE
ncbi:hypothetical protein Ahy_B06g084046 [Arachis hypogaea]|uniref:Protein FAR1-RELATED SEQUENCE n=1 Tax=Arachis hypogaea TaxID=3818 RepID=A0A444YR50_ARAHY|nr:hypothetical protein Ahy_B06g084046 [Arachis hypogaea]